MSISMKALMTLLPALAAAHHPIIQSHHGHGQGISGSIKAQVKIPSGGWSGRGQAPPGFTQGGSQGGMGGGMGSTTGSDGSMDGGFPSDPSTDISNGGFQDTTTGGDDLTGGDSFQDTTGTDDSLDLGTDTGLGDLDDTGDDTSFGGFDDTDTGLDDTDSGLVDIQEDVTAPLQANSSFDSATPSCFGPEQEVCVRAMAGNAANSVAFQMTFPQDAWGWSAIGYGNAPQMPNNLIYVVYHVGEEVIISERQSEGRTMPLQTDQNFNTMNAMIDDQGMVVAEWEKVLGPDTADLGTEGTFQFIWALAEANVEDAATDATIAKHDRARPFDVTIGANQVGGDDLNNNDDPDVVDATASAGTLVASISSIILPLLL